MSRHINQLSFPIKKRKTSEDKNAEDTPDLKSKEIEQRILAHGSCLCQYRDSNIRSRSVNDDDMLTADGLVLGLLAVMSE